MNDAVFSACRLRLAGVALMFLAVGLTGCSTTTYVANSKPGPAKPADYPILVYTEDKTVPRPCEVIGSISIQCGNTTIFGGSIDKQMAQVMAQAHEKGADVVKYTAITSPTFANPNYSVRADLLRYSDVWETIAISHKQFLTYLATHREHLDPIEGIWVSSGMATHAIGIMRDSSKPGRDFVGFLLQSGNLTWPMGAKKMDVRSSPVAGTYRVAYYLDNYDRADMPVILGGDQRAFKLTIWREDNESAVIIYTKQ